MFIFVLSVMKSEEKQICDKNFLLLDNFVGRSVNIQEVLGCFWLIFK